MRICMPFSGNHGDSTAEKVNDRNKRLERRLGGWLWNALFATFRNAIKFPKLEFQLFFLNTILIHNKSIQKPSKILWSWSISHNWFIFKVTQESESGSVVEDCTLTIRFASLENTVHTLVSDKMTFKRSFFSFENKKKMSKRIIFVTSWLPP